MTRKERKLEKAKAACILAGMKGIEELLDVDSKTMSEILGISYGHYRNIVNYKYPLSPRMIVKMAEYANLDVKEILMQLSFAPDGVYVFLVPAFVEGYSSRSYYRIFERLNFNNQIEDIYEPLLTPQEDLIPEPEEDFEVKTVAALGAMALTDTISGHLKDGYTFLGVTAVWKDRDALYTVIFSKKE